jgi:hypothetical protein
MLMQQIKIGILIILQFEIINTIDGAVEALTSGTADYFMWERFMTKPLVDKGIFRRVGDCPTLGLVL